MLEGFFLGNPSLDVWPTFGERVLAKLKRDPHARDSFDSAILMLETYDNYLRFGSDPIGFIPIETVQRLLSAQLEGQPGALLAKGKQNVFYCESAEDGHPGFALQLQWLLREHDKKFRWLLHAWSLNALGVWPDWGTYRPAGTKVFW